MTLSGLGVRRVMALVAPRQGVGVNHRGHGGDDDENSSDEHPDRYETRRHERGRYEGRRNNLDVGLRAENVRLMLAWFI